MGTLFGGKIVELALAAEKLRDADADGAAKRRNHIHIRTRPANLPVADVVFAGAENPGEIGLGKPLLDPVGANDLSIGRAVEFRRLLRLRLRQAYDLLLIGSCHVNASIHPYAGIIASKFEAVNTLFRGRTLFYSLFE